MSETTAPVPAETPQLLLEHVHILEMNGDSYRLKQSRGKRSPNNP
jgi:DNA replication protein DnaC